MFNILEFHLDPESYVPLMDQLTSCYIELRTSKLFKSISQRCMRDFSALNIEGILLKSGFKNILCSICDAYHIEPLWVDFEKHGDAGTDFFSSDSL